MSSLGTLVFLCSCLHPYPCIRGFVNVVDLLLEYTCLHKEVKCVLFEAEIDSYDSCLIEVVDCVPMVDMSLHQEGGHSHTWCRQRVRIELFREFSCFGGIRTKSEIGYS